MERIESLIVEMIAKLNFLDRKESSEKEINGIDAVESKNRIMPPETVSRKKIVCDTITAQSFEKGKGSFPAVRASQRIVVTKELVQALIDFLDGHPSEENREDRDLLKEILTDKEGIDNKANSAAIFFMLEQRRLFGKFSDLISYTTGEENEPSSRYS